MIIILNAVIAIVSDIFDQVYENMNKNLLKELVILMAESELLISRKSLFKSKKYILLVEIEKGDAQVATSETKIGVIKDFMDGQIKKQHRIIQKMERNLQTFIDRKRKSWDFLWVIVTIKSEELENFTEKRLDTVNQQLEILDLHHKGYQDLYQRVEDKVS